jgi:hypothetical protein
MRWQYNFVSEVPTGLHQPSQQSIEFAVGMLLDEALQLVLVLHPINNHVRLGVAFAQPQHKESPIVFMHERTQTVAMFEAVINFHGFQRAQFVLLLELPEHVIADRLVSEQSFLVEVRIIGEPDIFLCSLPYVDLHDSFHLLLRVVDDIVNAMCKPAVFLLENTQPSHVKAAKRCLD